VRAFGRGDIPEWIGPYVSINIACLDDVDQAELAELPVKYRNGRENDWMRAPTITRHL
jgi:hypothetical protein